MQSFLTYTLERELGRGASACVYLAREQGKGEVCLKLFHPRLFQDSEFSRRVRREMRLMSDLSHPNIVRVLQVYEDSDPPALVLDYIDGENLETFQARLPYVLPEIALLIVIEVLKALEYSHERGIIHRDLKPENVLVRRDGKVFVTDFGLAKMDNGTTITQTNAIVGSIDFMSPEQASGDRVGPESDLFSLAVILYFLTTGTRPFSRSTPTATLQSIRTPSAEAPQLRNPKISAGLSALIQKGLERDFDKRFGSAREFREAAEAYLADIGMVPDLFNLQNWISSPTAFALEMLRTASEQLVLNGEKALKGNRRADLLENLAHLSLKAPESPAIERLTHSLFKLRTRRAVYWLPLLLVFLGLGTWLILRPPTNSEQLVSPTSPPAASEVAKPPVPVAKAAVPAVGEVQFQVPENVEVYWDDKKVNPKVPLPGQKLGRHKLKMTLPGFDPIESTVEVRGGKPTVVKVQ